MQNKDSSELQPSDETRSDDVDDGLSIPVRLIGHDTVTAHYVSDVQVLFDSQIFHLVFSQFLPPPIVTPSDQERLLEQGFAPSFVVGRMVMTPELVEKTIRVLERQLQNFREQQPEGQDMGVDGDGFNG